MSVKDDRVIIITGATSGIGLAAAKEFASHGCRVYGVSRGRVAPPDIAGVTFITADVADEESVAEAVGEIIRREGRIDLLINNAGFGISGPAEFTDISAAKKQFDVNFFGMLACTKAALPYMRETGGMILNMSSVAAVVPIPFQAFYSASKAAINSFTMALANELRRNEKRVRVCALMPGDVKTGFTAAREKQLAGSDIYPALEKSVATMEHDEQNGMPPEALAKRAYRISLKKNPKPYYSCGFMYQFFCVLAKILPNRLVKYILGLMYA